MKEFKANIFSQLGASNHSDKNREIFDYYATDPIAVDKFLKTINKENIRIGKNIWECATGENHIKNVLIKYGYNVIGTDIVDRGKIDKQLDFLSLKENPYPNRTILTNPPYKLALEFLKKAYELQQNGDLIILMLKIQFLEGKSRYNFYKNNNPKYVLIHSSRVNCANNGDFETYKSSAMCYTWFIFEKGYKGDTILKWIE